MRVARPGRRTRDVADDERGADGREFGAAGSHSHADRDGFTEWPGSGRGNLRRRHGPRPERAGSRWCIDAGAGRGAGAAIRAVRHTIAVGVTRAGSRWHPPAYRPGCSGSGRLSPRRRRRHHAGSRWHQRGVPREVWHNDRVVRHAVGPSASRGQPLASTGVPARRRSAQRSQAESATPSRSASPGSRSRLTGVAGRSCRRSRSARPSNTPSAWSVSRGQPAGVHHRAARWSGGQPSLLSERVAIGVARRGELLSP